MRWPTLHHTRNIFNQVADWMPYTTADPMIGLFPMEWYPASDQPPLLEIVIFIKTYLMKHCISTSSDCNSSSSNNNNNKDSIHTADQTPLCMAHRTDEMLAYHCIKPSSVVAHHRV
jgi:hypothetical protein